MAPLLRPGTCSFWSKCRRGCKGLKNFFHSYLSRQIYHSYQSYRIVVRFVNSVLSSFCRKFDLDHGLTFAVFVSALFSES